MVLLLMFKTYLPSRIFPENNSITDKIVVDSLMLEAMSVDEEIILQSTNVQHHLVIDSANITVSQLSTQQLTNPIKQPEFIDDYNYTGFQNLHSFYEKWQQLATTGFGSIRIAYFSDSMTDGDMIVQDLRKLFQEKLGGEGIGFVSITSESANSRASVTHKYSENWKTQSYLRTKKPTKPFGVNGSVFLNNDTINDAWVSFKASKMKFITKLNQPTLYYGYSENKEGKVYRIEGNDTIEMALNPTQKLNKLRVSNTNLKLLKLYFKNTQNIPIYGLNFDNGNGVHVDNFSSRGNSGLPLSMLNVSTIKAFQQELGYDLIILHYGTNVLNHGSLNYNWYYKRMQKVVNHLKQCFANTDFLVISIADKATKYGTEMKTDSAVMPLLNAQRKYAIKTQSGFINLFAQMGGQESMIQWVETEPRKANKDYTHFNYKGSIEVAQLIYNQIEKGYSQYKNSENYQKTSLSEPNEIDSLTQPKDSIYAD